MTKVERLLVRQEIDALEDDLARAKRAPSPDFMRNQQLAAAIARLEARLGAAKSARGERRFA